MMLDRLKKILGYKPTAKPTSFGGLRKVDDPEPPAGPWNLRRFEGGQTNRLNAKHWTYAQGQPINVDLATDLPTLQARCAYEAGNNPYVAGPIGTYTCDLVGQHGPRLQVESDDERYNKELEAAWQQYFEMPDRNGEIGGPEMVALWFEQLFTAGSFVNLFDQFDGRRSGPFQFAIRSLHPRRMVTPSRFAGDPNVWFGIRFTNSGRRTQYYFNNDRQFGPFAMMSDQFIQRPASMVQHRFQRHEPEQITGYPWLTPALNEVADIRQFDDFVMQSAKNGAAQAVYWFTTDSVLTTDADRVDATIPIEPGMQQTGPPGYQPAMLNPTQPAATYQSFRHERLRGVGRVVNMPLMMVLLSSADNNFSSAHYDGQIYTRGIQSNQAWCSRDTLNPQVREIETEMILGGVFRRPTGRVRLNWTWPVPPYVDPKKMYEAIRAQIEDGTIDYGEALALFGRDAETTIARRKRFTEMLEEAGLPPLPVNSGRGTPQETLREVADGIDEGRMAQVVGLVAERVREQQSQERFEYASDLN